MSRALFVQYCDDVRQEVGNKLSFMGLYGPRLILTEALPVSLPKLFVVMSAITDAADPFKTITFRVFQDDLLISEQGGRLETPPDLGPESKIITAGFIVPIIPLIIERPFKLRVRAETEREELRGSALLVEVAPPVSAE